VRESRHHRRLAKGFAPSDVLLVCTAHSNIVLL
jgi:hypothetical protein